MKRLVLNPREERRLLRGHAWCYRNEFASIPECEDGEVVDIYSSERRFVGRGFFQAVGGIAARIMTHHQTAVDEAFLARRLEDAYTFRRRLFPGQNVYRWIFGESDGLPGLVADRYGAVVALQTSCTFYIRQLDVLEKVLMGYEGIEGIRMEIGREVAHRGIAPESIEVELDGVRVSVSLNAGQKTGLFLDQRANWPQVRRFAPGARVLDGHCYRGMWSVHAAMAGARDILGVDTSAPAVEGARVTARLNQVDDRCRFECADVMEVLARGERYDVIILDPPALAKSRGREGAALGLYQALNKAAIQALEPGGILFTSSCSHFVAQDAFVDALKRAACAAQRTAWLLEMRGAAPDHPVLLSMPETAYLKCAVLRVS